MWLSMGTAAVLPRNSARRRSRTPRPGGRSTWATLRTCTSSSSGTGRTSRRTDDGARQIFFAISPVLDHGSQKPYSDEVGGSSLINALGQSVARHQITRDKRCTTWHVPENISARYIRVQLEGL